MLKRKALKKIMITTLSVCLLLAIYLMPSSNVTNNTKNKLKVKYSEALEQINIYLLNNENLLVRTSTFVDKDKELIDKAKSVLNNLIDASNDLLPNGLNGIIPKKTKVMGLTHTEGIVNVNFSKELLNVELDRQEKLLEAVTFSLLDIDGVNGVIIQVDESNINTLWKDKNLPIVFDKSYGINKKYDIRKTKDIQKVVIYYIEEIDKEKYYVPITKYIDDNREKISIIIEELSSNYIYEPNLVSYLNQNTELINFEIDNDTMILNFNTSIFMSDKEILEEVIYTISYSVFDNYEVKEVIFRVDNEEILKKTLKNIEFVE